MTPADDVLSEYWKWKTSKKGDPMVRKGGQMKEQISLGLIFLSETNCLLLPLPGSVWCEIPALLGGLTKPRLEQVGGN